PDLATVERLHDEGQSNLAISRITGLSENSLRRHWRHRRRQQRMKRAILAGQRRSAEEQPKPPEGTDPLLWELGQLREPVQRSVAYAESAGDLRATASLVRAGNGLLDLLARIEKAKAEEAARKAATASLEDRQAIKASLHEKLDLLAGRMRQAETVQKPLEEKP